MTKNREGPKKFLTSSICWFCEKFSICVTQLSKTLRTEDLLLFARRFGFSGELSTSAANFAVADGRNCPR